MPAFLPKYKLLSSSWLYL